MMLPTRSVFVVLLTVVALLVVGCSSGTGTPGAPTRYALRVMFSCPEWQGCRWNLRALSGVQELVHGECSWRNDSG